MNEQIWWHVARAGGIVAWLLLALSVTWGLLLSTKLLGRKPAPAWLLSLHRMLGGLAVVFTVVHVGGLIADSYVHFGPSDVLVPFASEWKPGPVAWGVVGFHLLLAVEVSSLLMRRIPRTAWKWVHRSSFVCFVVASLHGATAGTDASNALYRWTSVALVALAMFLTLVRVLTATSRRARIDVVRPRTDRTASTVPAA
ncbi:MAG: hypothetical protein KatS3mg010_0854 [Acidimicrobiia bacterium]|nr:MAG: hypothetical protein KatS3mg010_0854 [Acidimicrobiia bacterium]